MAIAFLYRLKNLTKSLLHYLNENPGALFIIAFQISLLIAAYYLILGDETLANDIAIYAYYFLVLGVIFQALPTKLASISILVAALSSTSVFFILDRETIVYSSFLLFIAIILTISNSLFIEGSSTKVSLGRLSSKFISLIPQIFVILSPLISLIDSNSLLVLFKFPLLLLVFTFFIGKVVLDFSSNYELLSLNTLTLASGVGISLTSILSFIVSTFDLPVSFSISILYALVGVTSFLKKFKFIKSNSSSSLTFNYKTLVALSLIFLFFLLGLFEVTKFSILVPSSLLNDYVSSKILERETLNSKLGDKLGTSLFLSPFFENLRITNLEYAQLIVIVFLFSLSLLSTYSFAKFYFQETSIKSSLVFMVFLFLFSGNFWLKILQGVVYGNSASNILPLLPISSYDLLSFSSQTFFGSCSNFILIILFSSFLLTLRNLSSIWFSSFVIVTYFSLAFPLVFFLVLTSILILSPIMVFNQREDAKTLLTGILASLIVIFLANLYSNFSVYVVVALSLIVATLTFFLHRQNFYKKLNPLSRKISFIITYSLFSVCLISLFAWLNYPWDSNSTITPTYGFLFFSEFSGILLYLATLSIFFFLLGKERSIFYETSLVNMLISFLVLFVLSSLNLYVYNTQLNLQQVIDLFNIDLAILATFGFSRVASVFKSSKFSKYLSLIFVCFVSLYGLNSYVAAMNFKANEVRSYSQLSQQELEAINFLDDYFSSNKNSLLIASRNAEASLASSPPEYLKEGLLLFYSSKPELVNLLLSQGNKKILVYLSNKDVEDAKSSLFYSYLNSSKLLFKNEAAAIYEVTSVSKLSPRSSNVLIVPSYENVVGSNYSYVFSLLSELNSSFTTRLDTDANLFSSKNLFLSYDPPIPNYSEPTTSALFLSFLESFIDEQKARGSYIVGKYALITGNWSSSSGLLIGGNGLPSSKGFFVPNKNFSSEFAEFSITPFTSSSLSSAFGFVYDFKDTEHFRALFMIFKPSGVISVYRLLVNGSETNMFPFGGKDTIPWFPGETLIFGLNISSKFQRFYLDNQEVLSLNETLSYGKLGFFYYGFYYVVIGRVTKIREIPLRSVSDYLNFLLEGGNLTVFNTNGYNFFAMRLLNVTYSTVAVNKFVGSKNFSIPETNVSLVLPLSNVSVVSYFEGNGHKIPFVVSAKIGRGTLTYVNLYNLINSRVISILGKLLESSGVKLQKEPPYIYEGSSAAFLSAKIQGKTILSSSSAAFNINVSQLSYSSPVTVFFNDSRMNVTLGSIRYISITNMKEITIEAPSVTILKEGNGFYQNFIIEGDVWIKFPGYSKITLFSGTPAQSVSQSFNGSNLALHFLSKGNRFIVCLFQPNVSATGNIVFSSFYTFDKSLPLLVSSDGNDVSLEGQMNFKITASDNYKLIKVTSLAVLNKNVFFVDDRILASYLIFWVIATLPFLVFSALIKEEILG
ncbi:MAG: hypothetical protein QW314_03120 [Thermoproteota archaeon]